MRQLVGHHALIIAVASAVFIIHLGESHLWDRDEPRNAGCAAEMLARGDWVVPIFNGELRTAKPVLLYWLIMSSYAVFGINEFAARFPSALLGIGTVLVTYHIGKRLFNAQVGLWSALLLTTSLMFNVASRAATPDAALIFFSTLALLVFTHGQFPSFPKRPSLIVLMYALTGLGVLAKGPIGLVLPMAVMGMFLLIHRLPAKSSSWEPDCPSGSRNVELPAWKLAELTATLLRPFAPLHFLRTLWAMWPWAAVGVVLVVSLPWYGWVHFRSDGQWVREFLLVENVGRAAAPMENHRGTPLFYPVALLVGFFPASIFVGATVANATRAIRDHDVWRKSYIFLFCWVGVIVFIFTLAQTKLPSYVTPAHPALAILSGCFFYRWTRGEFNLSPWRGRVIMTCLAVVGIVLAVAVYVAGQQFLPGERWLWSIGLILPVGAAICVTCVELQRRRTAATVFVVTGMLFCTVLFGYGAARVGQYQQIDQLLAASRLRTDQPRLACYGCLEPSWVFYSGQSIHEFGSDGDAAREFLRDHPANLVITTDRHLAQLQRQGFDEVQILGEVPYFLKKDRLILIGRSNEAVAAMPANFDSRQADWR